LTGPRAVSLGGERPRTIDDVIAVDVLARARALDLRRPLRSSDALERVHATIRDRSETVGEDRPLSAAIEHVADAIRGGSFRPHALAAGARLPSFAGDRA